MKKIISIILAGMMLTSAIPAMATTEGIIQGDIMMISANEEITTEATEAPEVEATEVPEATEAPEAEATEAPEATEMPEGEATEAPEATEMPEGETTEDVAVTDDITYSYNTYRAVVNSFENDVLEVTIEEDMIVSFRVTDETQIFAFEGEDTEINAGDTVYVASTSLLETKDIKFADVIVIADAETEMAIYVDTFSIVEDELISADNGLILNVEDATEYDGKKLLVVYSMMTMSLPAQAVPEQIIVLEEPEAEVSIKFQIGDSVLNINGEMIEVEAPYIAGEGTTLVPLRVISEAFGAEVVWNGETKEVTVTEGDKTIVVTIDSTTATVNGEEKVLEEAPALTETGFTMINLRFIAEELGATVGYEHETQAITVVR